MRIHLGHHFYGAGNLGDDFMLAGFLRAMARLAPDARFTCCVPFPRPPLQQRFPAIEWLPYDDASRSRAVEQCDFWLGLGGSPFQSAQSRWFVDHLVGEGALCERAGKSMFFLGVGVQTKAELAVDDVRMICQRAAGIWTRDPQSAELLRALPSAPGVEVGADLAHVFFRENPPPAAVAGRVVVVANFDYGAWPGQAAFLEGVAALPARESIWLAQESRELPGAERALYASLPNDAQRQWSLVSPDIPGAELSDVMRRWPTGEWLVTARYHAALAGGWAGSKVIVLPTNEKLRAAARDLSAPLLPIDASAADVVRTLRSAQVPHPPLALADRALASCAAMLRSAVAPAG